MIEEYVKVYGEQHRTLIIDALRFLYQRDWYHDVPNEYKDCYRDSYIFHIISGKIDGQTRSKETKKEGAGK